MKAFSILREYGQIGNVVELSMNDGSHNPVARRGRILKFTDHAVLCDFDDALQLVDGQHIVTFRILKTEDRINESAQISNTDSGDSGKLGGNTTFSEGTIPQIDPSSEPAPLQNNHEGVVESVSIQSPDPQTPRAVATPTASIQSSSLHAVFRDPPVVIPYEPTFTFSGLNRDQHQLLNKWKSKYEYACKVNELSRIRSEIPEIVRLCEVLHRGELYGLAGYLAFRVNDIPKAKTLLRQAGALDDGSSLATLAHIAIVEEHWDDAADYLIRAGLVPTSDQPTVEMLVQLGRCLSRCTFRQRTGIADLVRRCSDHEAHEFAELLLVHVFDGAMITGTVPRKLDEFAIVFAESAIFKSPARWTLNQDVAQVVPPTNTQSPVPSTQRAKNTVRADLSSPAINRSDRVWSSSNDGAPARSARANLSVRLQGLPKAHTPYATAKRMEQLDKLDDAAACYREEILRRGPQWQSAIKDLALLLSRMGKDDAAIELLDEHYTRFPERRSVDSLKVNILVKSRRFLDAAAMLRKLQTGAARKSVPLLARQEAFCLHSAGRSDEALAVLDELKRKFSDDQHIRVLRERIVAEKRTGVDGSNQEHNPELLQLVGLGDPLSEFALHAVRVCDLHYVDERSKARGFYDLRDFEALEKQAHETRGRRPRERGELWLTMAALQHQAPNAAGDRDIRDALARAFRSMGEASALDGLPRDTTRCYLVESLIVLAGGRNRDLTRDLMAGSATHLLVTYLSNAPGLNDLMAPDGEFRPSVAFARMKDDFKGWQAFCNDFPYYSALSPGFAEIVANESLVKRGSLNKPLDFTDTELMGHHRQREAQRIREEASALRSLRESQFSAVALQQRRSQLQELGNQTRFELDKERLRNLAAVFETSAKYCMERDYVVRESQYNRLCLDIDTLNREIDRAPTKLSVEYLMPIIAAFKVQLDSDFRIYEESAKPVIDVTHLLGTDYCLPNEEGIVTIALEVASRPGGAPVEDLEICPVEVDGLVCVEAARSPEPLRGGFHKQVSIRIRPTQKQIEDRAFTCQVTLHYKNRHGQSIDGGVHPLPVRIGNIAEFHPIDPNPYEDYSGGGEVANPEMFFGRQEVIDRIIRQMTGNKEGQCFVLYGQKRSGKSSVLVQVEQKIQKPHLAVHFSLGVINAATAEKSFVAHCLETLRTRVFTTIEHAPAWWPTDADVDTDPILAFIRGISAAKEALSGAGWSHPRIVLLVDEFTYVYEFIREGIANPTFMKQWKGLLEKRIFNAVLVGQDSMPKFKAQFENEFGRTYDERLTYLSPSEAKDLAERPILMAERSRYRGKSLDKLLRLTAGSPFYLQLFCDRLVWHMNKQRAPFITEVDVDAVLGTLVSGDYPLPSERFDPLITVASESVAEATRDQYFHMLEQIARASTLDVGASRADLTHESNVEYLLNDLESRAVVDFDSHGKVHIKVGLFAEWLRRRFNTLGSLGGA